MEVLAWLHSLNTVSSLIFCLDLCGMMMVLYDLYIFRENQLGKMRLHISFCAFYCSLSSILFSYFHQFMLLRDREWKYERETEYIMTLLSRPSYIRLRSDVKWKMSLFFFNRMRKVENLINLQLFLWKI